MKYLVIMSFLISVSIYGQNNRDTEKIIYDFQEVEIILGEVECKRKEKKIPKECAKKAISRYIFENFNLNIAAEIGLDSGTFTTNLSIILNEQGDLINYEAKSDIKELKEEYLRVLETMPNMFSGVLNGKPVQLRHEFPAIFKVQ